MKTLVKFLAATSLLPAFPALAHVSATDHAHTDFAAGLAHPFLGVDHILAMVAVGLWASTLGRRGLIAVPAAFVGVMVLGFLAALGGLSLPLVEPVILASVAVLGLAIAFALPVSPLFGAAVAGFFGFFHGYAHGAEIGGAHMLTYGAGFVLATVVLHAVGLGLGVGAGRLMNAKAGRLSLRVAGGAIAAWGLLMMVG